LWSKLQLSSSFQLKHNYFLTKQIIQTGPNVIKLLTAVIYERLSLAGLYSLVECLWVKPGGLSWSLASDRCFTRESFDLTRLEKPAKCKHSSLLQTLVNYGWKKFYDFGAWSNNRLTKCPFDRMPWRHYF